jgi:uncharacterized membrane protein YphA (DoxX/SURF4 family)
VVFVSGLTGPKTQSSLRCGNYLRAVLRRLSPWLGLVARLVVGGVFLVSGAIKLPDPAQSVAAVRAYEALPSSLVTPVGQLLPVLEVVIGLLLVLGLLTRSAAAAAAVLLVVFVVGIVSVWVRGIEIDCGCFGDGGYDPDAVSRYPWEIARDVGLFIAAIYLTTLKSTKLSLDSRIFGGS